jgi:hypothetical protein
LNSIARWRECSEPITLPDAVSSAANRLEVPLRLSSWVALAGVPASIGTIG